MKKSIRCTLAVLSVMAFAVPVLAEDTVESVEKKLVEAWDSVKSATGKMSMLTEMEQHGTPMKMNGAGEFQMLKKDDKVLSRMNMQSNMSMGSGEQAVNMSFKVLQIVDGEFSYVYREGMGQPMAAKSDIDANDMQGGAALFTKLHEDYEVKLMPEEQIDGAAVYVFSCTPKEANENSPVPVKEEVRYFDQKSGMLVKTVANTEEGKPFMTMTITDLKLNEELDPKQFVFEAPEGVTVTDHTKK
jgi:outer membrane lipoprotein-sorting protein